MTDHDERLATPDDGSGANQQDAFEPASSGDATDDPDPTFADGTAREIGDTGQPLTREDEGMDR